MNIKEIIQNIRNRLQKKDELSDEAIQGFLHVLEKVRVEETTCKEVFAQLDEFVEKEIHGQDASRLMPLLREHLDLCSDCCEEYEALMSVLEMTARKS